MSTKHNCIKIICNNTKVTEDTSIKEWGLSLLINDNILFDTSEAISSLKQGLESSNIATDKIEKVVISHNHWDHKGGIPFLLEKSKNLTFFVTSDFDLKDKTPIKQRANKCLSVTDLTEIEKGIYITKEFVSPYNGQDLSEICMVIEYKQSIALITGCAHADIVSIVNKIKKIFPSKTIDLIIGGFHLSKEEDSYVEEVVEKLQAAGVKAICPIHCSGKYIKEYTAKKYPNFLILPEDNPIFF